MLINIAFDYRAQPINNCVKHLSMASEPSRTHAELETQELNSYSELVELTKKYYALRWCFLPQWEGQNKTEPVERQKRVNIRQGSYICSLMCE